MWYQTEFIDILVVSAVFFWNHKLPDFLSLEKASSSNVQEGRPKRLSIPPYTTNELQQANTSNCCLQEALNRFARFIALKTILSEV